MSLSKEQALIARAQTSSAGFGELFDLYYERVYAYAYRRVGTRAVADDIAACTFEDALRGIKRLSWQGKPVIAWLYKIASRRVADYYRRGDRGTTSLELVADPDPQPGPDVSVERAERQAAVRAGFAKLNARDQEIIRLIYFEELEAAQAAATLGCTSNSVYVRLHRALKHLQVVLEEGEQDR